MAASMDLLRPRRLGVSCNPLGVPDLSAVNLNLLVSLVHLHEQRSVSGAARALGLTQSAMSYNLKRLRAIFDDPLFVRDGRMLMPTPVQEQLIVSVRRGLSELERALSSPLAFDPKTSDRRFRIVCNDYVEGILMPRVMERLSDEAPHVCLELVPYNRASCRAFEGGEYEVLTGSDELAATGEVRTSVMYRDPLVCIEAARGQREPLTLERYLARPHIHVHVEQAEGVADGLLREQGTARRIRLRVPNFASVPRLVAAGDAFATIPLAVVLHAPLRERLWIHRPPMELQPICGRLFWHERFDSEPGTRWLLELLREVSQEVRDGLELELQSLE